MVTLSVTRSRVAGVLRATASLLEREGWDPLRNPVMSAIDRAAGYVPGKGTPDAEETTLAAWDALVMHVDERLIVPWERAPGRTQEQIVAGLRAAADGLAS
ncbi:hypothetical protein AB0872_20535 [Microbacterium sp. NPDC047426]